MKTKEEIRRDEARDLGALSLGEKAAFERKGTQ
jgi:hypothetical protein